MTVDELEPEVDETESGCLDILNVGTGHMRFTFNSNDSADVDQARRAIEDMLRRGYSLFIELKDKTLKRVDKFNPKTGCYVVKEPVVQFPKRRAHSEKKCIVCGKAIRYGQEFYDGGPGNASHEKCGQPPPKLGRRGVYKQREVPMHKAKVTAVGRSAGG